MPVVIEELTTTLEVQDEVKIRKLIKQEFERLVHEKREDWFRDAAASADPSDSTASGIADEG